MSDEEYGSRFLNPIRLGWEENQDLAYLTSRGVLEVNFALLNDPTLLPKLEDRIRKIKPLHIVYDGMIFILPQTSESFVACSTQTAEIVTIYPLPLTDISSTSNIIFGCSIQVAEIVTIFPSSLNVITNMGNIIFACTIQVSETIDLYPR